MRTFFLMVALAVGAAGCASLGASASQDPMKCERDPKCEKKNRAADCSVQCADDPACVARCSEVNQGTGAANIR